MKKHSIFLILTILAVTDQNAETNTGHPESEISANRRIRQTGWIVLRVIAVFMLDLGSGYLRWGQDETAQAKQQKDLTALYEQVNPPELYPIEHSTLFSVDATSLR